MHREGEAVSEEQWRRGREGWGKEWKRNRDMNRERYRRKEKEFRKGERDPCLSY